MAELTGTATGKVAEYSYYPGLDRPHAVITGTTPAYAHTDGLGNVRPDRLGDAERAGITSTMGVLPGTSVPL